MNRQPKQDPANKPPYRIPLMDEIRAVPLNGLTVASTFSGCGGSCLGFRWAGFRHVYANEFIPAARETYLANFPGAVLDDRDIRTVQPADILRMGGLRAGELDVLEGSPPCASFSSSGKGSSGWGEVKAYSDTKQRTDDLFDEFIRLLSGLKPRAFIAENVAGLVRGAAKGYFLRILEDMTAAGYHVECRILDAQWLGVPQVRRRTIFFGTRDDLATAGILPLFPRPLSYRFSISDVLTGSETVAFKKLGSMKMVELDLGQACPAIMAVGVGGVARHQALVRGPNNPESIVGQAIGAEWSKLKPGESSEKYMNLVRSDPEGPVSTITQMGGRSGAATVTHPSEQRKFTIPELRRLSGFPDDFILTGTYEQQWERIGRAVPPPMMRAVAAEVAKVLQR